MNEGDRQQMNHTSDYRYPLSRPDAWGARVKMKFFDPASKKNDEEIDGLVRESSVRVEAKPTADHLNRIERVGKWHGVLCLWHLVLAILAFVLAARESGGGLDVGYRAYDLSGFNSSSNLDNVDFYNRLEWISVGSVNLKFMAGAFALLTSVSHFVQGIVFYSKSEWALRIFRERCNPMQWIEYTVTVAPLMSLALGAIAGERSIVDYLNRAGCQAAMMFCGYLSERHPQSNIMYHVFGWFFGSTALIQDIVLLSAVPSWAIPEFVKVIISVTYIFFFSFTIPAMLEIYWVNAYKCTLRPYYDRTLHIGQFLSVNSKSFLLLFILFAPQSPSST